MVREVPDGHMVIEAQKQTGRILQVGSQRVSSILYAKAKELIKSGKIGQVHLIEAYINRNSALVLLCYKRRAQQRGQQGSWCTSRRAMRRRSVAIEVGLCRSARAR
jgi:predicted dehydrogenase